MQASELLRKRIDVVATSLIQLGRKVCVLHAEQGRLQGTPLAIERRFCGSIGCGLVGVWERKTPDLIALFCAVGPKEFVEPSQQVNLGHPQIDRKLYRKGRLKLIETLPQRGEMGQQFVVGIGQQIRNTQRQHHAVDGLSGAVLLEQA